MLVVTYGGLLLTHEGGSSGNKRGKDSEFHFYLLWSINNLNKVHGENNQSKNYSCEKKQRIYQNSLALN